MKKIFLAWVVSCFSLLLQAQTQAVSKITGTVKSGDRIIEAASVALLTAKDSVVIKIEVTDKNGKFELAAPGSGKFLLLVSAVGFENKYAGPVTVASAGKTVPTGVTYLVTQSRDMKAVVITAKKPLVEQKIDKLVVNVDAAPTNAGATAMEVLEKSPGITVDNDGNVSLKGKPGVMVMMDGKPAYLSAADLANLLKNTPASAIDQIEIMSNPSSKYDAAGNSGIINIKTKKSLKTGLNGSIMTGATAGFFSKEGNVYVQPKSQHSFNFNYRKNKINLFGNYNPNFNKRRNELAISRKFYNDDGTLNASAVLGTDFTGRGDNHSAKLGADYYINSKNVMGIVFTGFGFFGDFTPSTISNIYNPDGSLQSGLYSSTTNSITFRNYTGNINYKHSFDSLGRELTIDIDYVKYDNVSNMLLTTSVTNKWGNTMGDPVLLKGHLPSDIDIYSFKSDYVHPFRKDLKIETGVKVNYVKNNNIVDYTRYDAEEWVKDFRSNHFIYEENINAAYINVNKKLSEKWSAQAGLRAENTHTKGYQVTNDSSFKRQYTNLFPTAFVSYAVNKHNQLTLSYSRRVNRPNYQDLNPFIYFLDSLTYQKGNPYLLPQFSHNIELSHSFKGKFITTLNYSKTTDVISQILRQNTEEKTTFQTTENVSQFRNIGLAVTAPFKWTSWFSTHVFANLYNNRYKGIYNGMPIDADNTAYMINLTNSFTLSQGFSAELSGFYRSEGLNGLLVMKEMYQMNIGLQKNLMKGKSTVRLNFRDPFGWQQFGGYMRYGDVDVTVKNRWDTRQVTASFTYRFGKSTIAPSRRRATGVSEEINRAGQSD